MSETQSNHSGSRKRSKDEQAAPSHRPKPTAVNHARLAEKCKQSGVPHYTAENPHPEMRAVLDEIFGSGAVLFTGVRSSSRRTADSAHKQDDGDARGNDRGDAQDRS